MDIEARIIEDAKYQERIERQVASFRFTYRTLNFATKAAKRLRRAFNEEGFPPLTIGKAKALIAQLAGYSGWEKLKAGIDPESGDQIDQELDERALVERRHCLSIKLARLISKTPDECERVLAIAEPTGSASGLLRWDYRGAFFNVGNLPVGADVKSALDSIGSEYPNFRRPYCVEHLRDWHFPEPSQIKVIGADRGTGIVVSYSGETKLTVEYERRFLFDLERDFVEDDFEPHPRPLRPAKADRLDVEYALQKAVFVGHVSPSETKEVMEAAAVFIAMDLIQTTCLCAGSVGTEIGIVDASVDANFDDPLQWQLANLIAELYAILHQQDQEIGASDPETSGKLALMTEIAPFQPMIALEDN